MMEEREFNLVDEPWIKVLMSDGEIRELNIAEVFSNAQDIIRICGESKAQDVCIMRVLLSILYASVIDYDSLRTKHDAIEQWKALWDRNAFETEEIIQYLGRYRDRFYLFDKERPFFQAPITKGTEYSIYKLIGDLSESENKPRLFSQISKQRLTHIGYAEAARWLLYLNSFDDTSAKPSVKGESMLTPGAGWLGKLGIIIIQGDSLFDSLLLNMVLTGPSGEPYPSEPRPIWEEDVPRYDERVLVAKPVTPMQLFTVQCRRTLLLRDESGVYGYRLLGGDVFDKFDVGAETMTFWKYDKNRLSPQRHDVSSPLWKELPLFMPSVSPVTSPGIVRWSSQLEDADVFPYGDVIFLAVGTHYAEKDFYADGCIDDSLDFDASLLKSINEAIQSRIAGECIPKVRDCIRYIGDFSRDLSVCAGFDPKQDSALISQRLVREKIDVTYRLDGAFRQWVRSFRPTDMGQDYDPFSDWYETLSTIVIKKGDEMLSESPELMISVDEKRNSIVKYTNFKRNVEKTIRGI